MDIHKNNKTNKTHSQSITWHFSLKTNNKYQKTNRQNIEQNRRSVKHPKKPSYKHINHTKRIHRSLTTDQKIQYRAFGQIDKFIRFRNQNPSSEHNGWKSKTGEIINTTKPKKRPIINPRTGDDKQNIKVLPGNELRPLNSENKKW